MATTRNMRDLAARLKEAENCIKALQEQFNVIAKILDEMTKPKPTPPKKALNERS